MTNPPLTERYVQEVVRRIPSGQRDDVANELRATIADTMDAQNPEVPDDAERAVLTEMGDPIRLAARYADRPLGLIGPNSYPTYVRLLSVLLGAVLPVVVVALMVLAVVDGEDLAEVLLTGIGATVTIGAQMIAWPTLVFALVERSNHRAERTRSAWSPDELPEAGKPGRSAVASCVSAVGNALLLGLIVWQQTARPYTADDESLEILNPELWSGWMWPVLAGLAGIIVLNLVHAVTPTWTVTMAGGYALSEALFALPMAWILYQQEFFNPPFLTHFNQGWTTPDEFYVVLALGILLIAASSVYGRVREALR
ncbi:hypothetical protein J4H86_18650 [Spiractinospora alimapuensis]|uniref:HAAS signaling domain-containing protein n=1 Tax=Spiractinospora alimapuensis TaxID=2820884 RepID=UPI001F40201E|nr:hypothetical protein [Spiractinospora alimapuensis]QVQ50867.1 hypothetical protein J4H86_18650 [Spiractinospora alimapuensis]